MRKAADEQACAGKQQHRESDLSSEQRAAQTAMPAARGSVPVRAPKRGVQVGARGADGWNNAEEDRSEESEAAGECEHPAVDFNSGAELAELSLEQIGKQR